MPARGYAKVDIGMQPSSTTWRMHGAATKKWAGGEPALITMGE